MNPVGISTGKRRDLPEIQHIIDRQRAAYEQSVAAAGPRGPILDAIETTLGWDTIYEPEKQRVVSPVSRVWSSTGAATSSSTGTRSSPPPWPASATATWPTPTPSKPFAKKRPKASCPTMPAPADGKAPTAPSRPSGAITVLGLYNKFHDRWFLEDAFAPASPLEPLVV